MGGTRVSKDQMSHPHSPTESHSCSCCQPSSPSVSARQDIRRCFPSNGRHTHVPVKCCKQWDGSEAYKYSEAETIQLGGGPTSEDYTRKIRSFRPLQML